MIHFAVLALFLQAAPAAPPLPADTAPPVFDSPGTQLLVNRVIREGGEIPAELRDYRADVRTGVYLSIRPDSALGGDLPVTVDEFVSDVRWERSGKLRQWIRDHRVRLLVPAPYTVGTTLNNPWVIPHLYGPTIDVFSLPAEQGGPRGEFTRALHPFSERGLRHYRFEAGDTIRVATAGETVTLVPITVHPRVPTGDPDIRLVVGSFWIDTRRAAVARARFGFTEAGRGLRLSETGVFFELENGLWGGRFWLPYRQRREIQVSSSLFGGAAAVRMVSAFSGVELNTGWTAEGRARALLIRDSAPGDSAFADFEQAVGEDAGEWAIDDFADLRRGAAGGSAPRDGLRVALRYERGDHLFRYNRVEGTYLGVGVRIEPQRPEERRWEVYATGGWAFAEDTPRGEVSARWRSVPPGGPGADSGWQVEGGAYRRLLDTQAFRPTLAWDWIQSFPALIGGYDVRDYYDATGVELHGSTRRGPWIARFGGRVEEHDSVARNTDQFLFGDAEDFLPLAPIETGTHRALEAEVRYARGTGALGIGNSVIASVRGEAGVGDFGFQRVIGLLSARRSVGPVTVATRVDAGHVWGNAPPQFLFTFGEEEGLLNYGVDEFGGSSAVIGRGRLLLHLPPYSSEPLLRAGFFLVPPLRPALVVSGDVGWSSVAEESADELLRLGARTADGGRTSVGVGVSIFDDALSAEWVRSLDGEGDEFRIGLVRWF